MRLGILQPYFFPYLGYYQLVNCVDHLVFLDDVGYIKNGWINRNQVQSKQGKSWVIVRAKKDTLGLILQAEAVDVAFDLKKMRKTIVQSYSRAHNFDEGMVFLDAFTIKICSCNSISEIAQESIKSVFDYLGIVKSCSCSSALGVSSAAEARVLDICKSFSADEYINPIGGVKLYDKVNFEKEGVSLKFLNKLPVQPQHAPDYWEDNASMLDLIFHCEKEELISLLREYKYE